MNISFSRKEYPAYTLMELLIVISIFVVLGGMSFAAFDGLQSTVKMNEYMLSLEQDIRSVQRSAMLLERKTNERWLYGLGIDFSQTTVDGEYRMFRWCSPFDDYGNIKTKSILPAYDPNAPGGFTSTNGYLPVEDFAELTYSTNSCPFGDSSNTVAQLSGYESSSNPPESVITINGGVAYVLFESVSGRTFFYNSSGELLNYVAGNPPQPTEPIVNFTLRIDPTGKGSVRILTISNLSGKITIDSE